MKKEISKIEFEQLNKIADLYKKNLYKDALFLAHYNRQKIPTLDNVPFFHNLIGLINFKLTEMDNLLWKIIHLSLEIVYLCIENR